MNEAAVFTGRSPRLGQIVTAPRWAAAPEVGLATVLSVR